MKKKIIFAISACMIMALAVLNMKVSFNDMEGSGVNLDVLQKAFADNTEGSENCSASSSSVCAETWVDKEYFVMKCIFVRIIGEALPYAT
jgi:hypothetical protein